MATQQEPNLSVPPIVVPTHGLARWVRNELGVTDGVMRWRLTQTLVGVVPLRTRQVAVPAADVAEIGVGRAVRPLGLAVGLATIVLPLVLGWGWWALLTFPLGVWICLVALGPQMGAVTSRGHHYRVDVCFAHQIDADLYMDAVRDIAAKSRAPEA